MKVKFSNKVQAREARIKSLPQYGISVINAHLKKDAMSVAKNFRDGIKDNSMGLVPLKDGTIERKQIQGYSNPENPLYGKGLSNPKSYVNMLRLRKLKNGWKIAPSKGSHWSKGITLEKLFYIHEYGCLIRGKGGKIIRIPSRPALKKAYDKTMQDRRKDAKETSRKVKKAMILYIDKGNTKYLEQVQKQEEASLRKILESGD